MKKILGSLLLVLVLFKASSQEDTLSLLFIGDIMGHDSQINAAWDEAAEKYDYTNVFKKVSSVFNQYDYAIANLEVTLAGKPFKGYPQFSSPDALAEAVRNSGINVLVTANNHACDRGGNGILRTIMVLDSLGIKHTGTFRNAEERASTNLLLLEKNSIRVGILNYTYGTNGLPVPEPTVVNKIDKKQMAADIASSKAARLDKLIVVVHWGKEYSSYPVSSQRDLALFLFNQGVDIIIGSHPHVIEPMEYYPATTVSQEQLVVYSLGNFISNQRKPRTDGGAMMGITLVKNEGTTAIADKGYYLTWVNKPLIAGKRKFEIVVCKEEEAANFAGIAPDLRGKIELFISDSRKLLKAENIGIAEY